MKYYSYIDNLNLTIEELINLSPYKLKEVIDEVNTLNIENKISIITGLEDSVSRSYHITIEQNIWLKDLFFKRIDQLKKSKIELSFNHLSYIGGLKLFIEPYIKPVLSDIVNQLIDENELKLLFQILNQSDLYSNDCKTTIIRLLKNKVNYAIDYLNQIPTNNLDQNIKYIKNYHFYEVLNIYEADFKDLLIKLHDTITDIFEKFDLESKDPIFKFVSQAQVAFKKSKIDDVATKLFIDNAAENAKVYAYNYSTEEEITKTKVPFQINSIILIFGITALGVLLSVFIFSNTKQSKEHIEVSQTKNNSKKKKTTYDNRIRFYYSLKRITKRAKTDTTIFNSTETIPFSNAYPKTFNKITNDVVVSKDINMEIVNNTGADLIVFKMVKGKDESLYIPKDNSIFIALKPLDSVLFYSGSNFITSKFSHFNNQMAISDIYKVSKIDNTTSSSINITSIKPTAHYNNRTISTKNIEISENIKLSKLSVDNLYSAYYKAYNN